MRHHVATDHIWNRGCALVNCSHWASEWPLLQYMSQALFEAVKNRYGENQALEIEMTISTISTDAWQGV